MTNANPITGPNALSTEDLTGQPAGGGQVWTCTEIPLDEIAKWTSRAANWMDRLGFYLFG